MSTSQLSPSAPDFYSTLEKVTSEIEPGRRVQVFVPRSISHIKCGWDRPDRLNYDELEEIMTKFRGSILNSDVFLVLRFDQKDQASDAMVDVCHFYS